MSRDISEIIGRGGTSAAEVLAKRVLQSGRVSGYREANYAGEREQHRLVRDCGGSALYLAHSVPCCLR